ncbi:spore coat protein YlbD [Fictibacillus sp. BK138]|uniref:spore coat protein YlbD n=1 Tax=Fictibacillus sp. BK138 TaxID=2512121 RepID=UPI0010E9A75A|nr:spore coat protein YlbD [Fictibacillus sp. BK138]RZT23068.1 putative coat protein YlbD-like [Fictibacillus sp. BK138]
MVKTDIESFKEFVHKHPELIKEVQKNKRPWKEVYQDWIVLGEEHESWNQYSKEKKKQQDKRSSSAQNMKAELTIGDIIAGLSKLQINDVQKYLSQFGSLMDAVQELLQQFNNQSDRPSQLPDKKMNDYPSYKD